MGMLLRRHYEENDRVRGAAKAVAPSPSEKRVAEEKPQNTETAVSAEDIKKMNGAKLRKLAVENGIENPEELTVGELKAILIEKYS
jgi:hypothetical protein